MDSYGDDYLPAFLRIEAELQKLADAESARDRARQIAARAGRATRVVHQIQF
ncbi:hypothetical protein U879_05750 [Defluviimonas sp. 20V17]|uniref:Uncharacterized protein n=1 Tax=Allgaiera indica TaxID=765699 RepID=A0AAN4UTA1_9RHOB|nr:hypothetical protein [Allgaiera indica]KDB04642.1 hypothetical protein U879_05750 [Defluviimonas sp. 20V17]GHE03726.1 hypothetical protein GCM10008024_28230 [Allgaiera indica]